MESTPPNPYSAPSADLYGTAAVTDNGGISPATIAVLAGTKPWVRFISVILWIGIAFMLLAAVGLGAVMLTGMSGASGLDKGPMGAAGLIFMVALYGLMAFLYIYPAVKLWAYATRIGNLSTSRSAADLDAALNEQRKFWKFFGVLIIIMICLYGVAFIGLIAAGSMGAMEAMKAGNLPVQP